MVCSRTAYLVGNGGDLHRLSDRLALRIPLTLIYVLGIIAILIKFKGSRWAAILCLVSFFCVLLWWLTLKPSNSGDWQPDADRTAWAEMDGDRVTIHNLRNCDYRTETDYANCWSDRTVYLSQLRGADFFLTNWGLSFASHPIISFQFGDNTHVAFSIEARYRPGQSYSTILGCFRQFGLIFVVADERDLIRLRTNYRKDEEVYMYRLNADPKHHARDVLHLCQLPEQIERETRVVQRADKKLHHYARQAANGCYGPTLSPGATNT